MRIRPLPLVLVALLAVSPIVTAPLAAQGTPATAAPSRPKLDKRADPNDWEAYFDYGVEMLNHHRGHAAAEAFWWSAQLDPSRAEPIFGQWVAFWMSDYARWEAYLADDPRTLGRPDVVAADSLPRRALARNPFVHQGLAVLLYDQMPGQWMGDHVTRGWLAFAQGQFDLAARELGKALEHDRRHRAWIHTTRAQAFLNLKQYDSTAAELHALVAEESVREQLTFGARYDSREMIHYALGILAGARGQVAESRAELGAALTENLGFAPAHDVLAQVLLAQGDTAGALTESEQAAQLAPDDPVLQYHHGVMLLVARRPADAIAPLRSAAAMRPWYAAPLYELGLALDQTGDRTGARAALARFADLAPRADAERIAAARSY